LSQFLRTSILFALDVMLGTKADSFGRSNVYLCDTARYKISLVKVGRFKRCLTRDVESIDISSCLSLCLSPSSSAIRFCVLQYYNQQDALKHNHRPPTKPCHRVLNVGMLTISFLSLLPLLKKFHRPKRCIRVVFEARIIYFKWRILLFLGW
jgi:hypothetical protein